MSFKFFATLVCAFLLVSDLCDADPPKRNKKEIQGNYPISECH